MSKELKALEWLKYYKKKLQLSGQIINLIGFDAIETALKDYEGIKDICKHYSIEFGLSNIREALFTFAQLKGDCGTNWDNYNKKLKALEIIKEKNVDVSRIKYAIKVACDNKATLVNSKIKEVIKPYIYYNFTKPKSEWLTEEDFDFLKEVLL